MKLIDWINHPADERIWFGRVYLLNSRGGLFWVYIRAIGEGLHTPIGENLVHRGLDRPTLMAELPRLDLDEQDTGEVYRLEPSPLRMVPLEPAEEEAQS